MVPLREVAFRAPRLGCIVPGKCAIANLTAQRSSAVLALARHTNGMAQRLSSKILDAGYHFAAETETNQLFPILPNALIEKETSASGRMQNVCLWCSEER